MPESNTKRFSTSALQCGEYKQVGMSHDTGCEYSRLMLTAGKLRS